MPRVSVPFSGGVLAGVVTADPDRLLTGPEVAALLGVEPSSWRVSVWRGYAPKPDDPGGVGPVNQRRPRWRLSTVRAFRQAPKRPGRRTDLGR